MERFKIVIVWIKGKKNLRYFVQDGPTVKRCKNVIVWIRGKEIVRPDHSIMHSTRYNFLAVAKQLYTQFSHNIKKIKNNIYFYLKYVQFSIFVEELRELSSLKIFL